MIDLFGLGVIANRSTDTDLIRSQIFNDGEKCDGDYSVSPNRTAIPRYIIHPVWNSRALSDKNEEESDNQYRYNESKNEIHSSIFSGSSDNKQVMNYCSIKSIKIK